MIDKDYARLETDVAFRFITHKLKDLVVSEYGQRKYVDQADEVFEDVFNVKKFFSRLEKAYDNRETIRIIHNFGFPILMVICNTPRYFLAIKDMIQILNRIDDIKKKVKNNQKKGKKKDKDLIKEFDYLQDLYKDSCKSFRKKLQIKKKSDYKGRYRAAADMANRDNLFNLDDDDDDFMEFGDSSDSFPTQSKYADVKLDDDSEFARMLRRAAGLDEKEFYRDLKKKKRTNYDPDSFDVEDDDDEDDEDDDDEDDENEDRRPNRIFKDDYDKKIDRLLSGMQNLTTVTQMLVNERMDVNQSEAYVAHKVADKMRPKSVPVNDEDEDDEADDHPYDDLGKEIVGLKNAVVALMQSQKQIIDNLNDVNQILDDAMQPDEDESEVQTEDNLNSQYNTVQNPSMNHENKKEFHDPNESVVRYEPGTILPEEMEQVKATRPEPSENMSRKELIDYANTKEVNMSKTPVKAKRTDPIAGKPIQENPEESK